MFTAILCKGDNINRTKTFNVETAIATMHLELLLETYATPKRLLNWRIYKYVINN